MLVQCVINGEEYLFVNVYLPPNALTEEKTTHFQKLWAHITKYAIFKIIVGGDFNEIVQPQLDVRTSRKGLGPVVFSTFLEETGLSDVWRAFHPDEKIFSYYRPSNTAPKYNAASRLDYFLVSDLALTYCKSACILSGIYSDHSPVVLDLFSNRNPRGAGSFSFPTFL